MGEVIRPNFGGKPREIAATKSPEGEVTLSQEEKERVTSDFQFFLANDERIKDAIKQADVITEYIFNLGGFQKKDESIDLRQNSLHLASAESLCTHLIESNEFQWKTQPHFYGAAILELHERCQIFALMKKHANSLIESGALKPPE